ncbi:MAG: alkaline shock response membrane anchor protein AmaP [Saccharofermentans sp.]|nr:alkaline shock response membrane anchor protein AmaP [Clostridiales bacterium]MCR4768011.1 alkaline shock response membrane anchor protein AmaP [Saccharofermentans sp.]
MNSFIRFLMFIYSVIIAVVSVVLLYALFDNALFANLFDPLSNMVKGPTSRYIYLGVVMLLFVTSIVSITNIITSGRLNRTRLRKNDIGTVDIGPDAIESIALNAAKSAQVGIKSARCHVAPAKNQMLRVTVSCELYSNVEIPASMSKVQEKVKKDIERFTGIAVEQVVVRVTKVEQAQTRVESR